jgi:hypothetical protein
MNNPDCRLWIEGKTYGPYTIEMIRAMYARGELNRTTPIWQDGASDWQSIEIFLGLPPLPKPSPSLETAKAPPVDKNVSWIAREGAGCLRVAYFFVYAFIALVVLSIIMMIVHGH